MQEPNIATQAASASWFAPVLAILCNAVAIALQVDRSVEVAIALFGFALFLFGFAAAIFALAMIRKYGCRKILIPATIGLVLNSAIIVMLVKVLILSARRG